MGQLPDVVKDQNQRRRIVQTTTVDALPEILNADTNMVIWQRHLPPRFAEFQASRRLGPELRCQFQVTRLTSSKVLGEKLNASRVGLGKEETSMDHWITSWMATDLLQLIEEMGSISRQNTFRLRVDQDLRQSCSRFHVDYIAHRMLCVYGGPGTEWLEEESANRLELGTDNERILRPTGQIQHLSEGDVAILKGEKYPGNQGRGVIHRSPDLNSSQARLLIALDPIE